MASGDQSRASGRQGWEGLGGSCAAPCHGRYGPSARGRPRPTCRRSGRYRPCFERLCIHYAKCCLAGWSYSGCGSLSLSRPGIHKDWVRIASRLGDSARSLPVQRLAPQRNAASSITPPPLRFANAFAVRLHSWVRVIRPCQFLAIEGRGAFRHRVVGSLRRRRQRLGRRAGGRLQLSLRRDRKRKKQYSC